MDRKRQYKNMLQASCRGSECGFGCCNCGQQVAALAQGTQHRNHCPSCLWSLHVDLCPGDRMSFCRGNMQPIAIWVKDTGEWALLHRCSNCGVIKSNRVAGDDNETLLRQLALRALGQRL